MPADDIHQTAPADAGQAQAPSSSGPAPAPGSAVARPTIAVIDGNSLMHRAFHAIPPAHAGA